MRTLTRSMPLLIPLLFGCYCCPGYYGPGLGCGPQFGSGRYNSCVDTKHLAPPLFGGRERRRPTLAERRQERELRRWYRDLNDSPRRGSRRGSACPHCGSGFGGFYDGVYGDEVVYDGQVFDGQIIDGAIMGGSMMGGDYCSSCQNQSGSYPTFSDGIIYEQEPTFSNEAPSTNSAPNPTPMPAPEPESNDSANFQSRSSTSQAANEYYFPPPPGFQNTAEPAPLQVPNQVQHTSVDQSLFVPPRTE